MLSLPISQDEDYGERSRVILGGPSRDSTSALGRFVVYRLRHPLSQSEEVSFAPNSSQLVPDLFSAPGKGVFCES